MNSPKTLLSVIIASTLTAACGGGGTGGADTGSIGTFSLQGSVGDGPIVGAQVRLFTNAGRTSGTPLAEATSDAHANYAFSGLQVSASDFPLYITADGGTDLVTGAAPDFALEGVVLDSTQTRVNLNPHSTVIVKTAGSTSGGMNAGNLSIATSAVVEQLNFGLDPDLIANPMTSAIGAANSPVIVKASEALAEAIRRTAFQLGVSEEAVIDALAADLIDGTLDGQGASHATPAVAAMAHVVSGQVLLETMANRLRVGGVEATVAMDGAIDTTLGSDGPATASVRIDQMTIDQAKRALAAVIEADQSSTPGLAAVRTAVRGLSDGAIAADVDGALPANSWDSVDNAITLTRTLDGAGLAGVITAANGDTGANSAPTIAGTPAGSVTEGSAYLFVPTANDADGDDLSFSITNKPSWASFNSATGTLFGTPGSNAQGSYGNIVIRVSDGVSSSALAAFTITVVNANLAPTIGGSPATAAVEGSAYSFTPSAADADGQTLTFSITNKPSWASFDTTTGALTGTPGFGAAGSYPNIGISVSDGSASASLAPFTITVANSNQAPVISGSPATAISENQGYSFVPSASDADGQALSFSIANKPSWASFNTATGALTGTPGWSDSGSYGNIRISVSDGIATTSLPAFTIGVAHVNHTPVANPDSATTDDLSAVNVAVLSNDTGLEDEAITVAVQGSPSHGSTLVHGDGSVTYTPTTGFSGVDSFTYEVRDNENDAALAVVTVTVNCVSGSCNRQIEVSWNTVSSAVSYRVYHGTRSGDYGNGVDVGNATRYTYTTGATGGHYFAITSVASNGAESAYSNEAYVALN